MATQIISLSDFQQQVLSVPEDFDLFLGGGRGGGKSYSLALLALRHNEQYGAASRILYVRRSYTGLRDFELLTRELFGGVYVGAASFNSQSHLWSLPNTSFFEMGQLEQLSDLSKYQGRSITLLLVDEAGQYSDPTMIDMLRANLRSGKGVPLRVALAANPGGPGHHWLARRYVHGREPWKPYAEVGRQWVSCPSTLDQNPYIDQAMYRDQLMVATATDRELQRAWVSGDWSIARGAYFADVLEESRNLIEPWSTIPDGWDTWLAHDYGSSAPSVTYIIARSPGASFEGRFYPRDSLVLVDELAAVHPNDSNRGLGWTAATTGEAIRSELCDKWRVKPEGVADDACFAKTGHGATIAEEFARVGVRFWPARKADRLTGWTLMRRLLADAGKPDKAGLFISRSCRYFWQTTPFLPRDLKRIEDVDSSGPDHAADACRYGCLRLSRTLVVRPLML